MSSSGAVVSPMFTTNATTTSAPPDSSPEINIPYTVCEVVVAVGAVVGNLLVILAFHRERRLRRRTNYYIVSLAAADFLVGLLGIPCALLASVGLPPHKHACLLTVSLLVVLCTISIFCLVAVSVDRYWAILHPMGYSRNVRTKTAIGIICVCWVAGTLVGLLPLMGWNSVEEDDITKCYFEAVMAPQFLVFLYFATIIGPATVMAAFYTHIYTVVLKQLKQMVTVNGTSNGNPGTMLRVLGAARKREVKATQNLSIIVLFFMVCWIPLYTINFFQAYYPPWHAPTTVTLCCIILSHLNSAGNPLLYAYHLRDFRAALRSLLFGAPSQEKAIGRDVTGYQDTEKVRKASSSSQVYPGALGAGPMVRGHRRSMTVPPYQGESPATAPVFRISSEEVLTPPRKRPKDLDLSCVLENSHSEEPRSLSVLGLQASCPTATDLTLLQSTSDLQDSPLTTLKQDSPLAFMDEKSQDMYGLGLVMESPVLQDKVLLECMNTHLTSANGKVHAFTENNACKNHVEEKVSHL